MNINLFNVREYHIHVQGTFSESVDGIIWLCYTVGNLLVRALYCILVTGFFMIQMAYMFMYRCHAERQVRGMCNA